MCHYCTNVFTIFAEKSSTEEEFNVEVFSLKLIEILGSQNINVNVIIKIYDEVKATLINILNLSLSTRISPDKLNNIVVSPIFKNDEKSLLTSYRPMSKLYNYFD